MERSYRWLAGEGRGLEHLSLQIRDDVVVADGVIVGEDEGRRFGASYRICCDAGWQVRSVEVHVAGGASCVLTSDGLGNWRDGDGLAQPQLAGCIDVDISATPFTNTLPIRRLGPRLAARTSIAVAYFLLPDMHLSRADQAYSLLGEGRYRFEAPGSGFEAEISVDRDGLVQDYPGLFRRLVP
jgi:hypothetical protein